jgi:hypothetical protein
MAISPNRQSHLKDETVVMSASPVDTPLLQRHQEEQRTMQERSLWLYGHDEDDVSQQKQQQQHCERSPSHEYIDRARRMFGTSLDEVKLFAAARAPPLSAGPLTPNTQRLISLQKDLFHDAHSSSSTEKQIALDRFFKNHYEHLFSYLRGRDERLAQAKAKAAQCNDATQKEQIMKQHFQAETNAIR